MIKSKPAVLPSYCVSTHIITRSKQTKYLLIACMCKVVCCGSLYVKVNGSVFREFLEYLTVDLRCSLVPVQCISRYLPSPTSDFNFLRLNVSKQILAGHIFFL